MNCSFAGCTNKAQNRDLCRGHHDQRRLGQELTPRRPVSPRGTNSGNCTFPACGRPANVRGLCKSHDMQRRKGVPLHVIGDREMLRTRQREAWARLTPEQRAARLTSMREAIAGPKSPEHLRRIAESNRAGWAARQGRIKPKERICRGCEVTYVATGPRQAYCTTDCRLLTDRLLRYGITRDDLEDLRAKQGDTCAICGSQAKGFSTGAGFHIDHCHSTGRVRGLLCGDCNTALGRFGDDPARLRRAAEYLERG